MSKSISSENIVDMSWLYEEVELATVTKNSTKNSISSKVISKPNRDSSMEEIDAILATVSFSLKRNLSTEQRARISERVKNRPPASKETCEKIKKAAALRRDSGVKLPKATEERKQKIRQAFQERKAAGWKQRLLT